MGRRSLALLLAFAACGGSPSAPRGVVATIAPPTTRSAVLPEVDARTPEGAIRFFDAMCAYAQGAERTGWLEERLSPTSHTSLVVAERLDGPIVAKLPATDDQASEMLRNTPRLASACGDLRQAATSIEDFRLEGDTAIGVVAAPGRWRYRFAITTGRWRTMLDELAVEVVPPSARRDVGHQPSEVRAVDARAVDGAEHFPSFIETSLRRYPDCIDEAAAGGDLSVDLDVHVVARVGRPTAVRVYPVSTANGLLVVCVEQELGRAFARAKPLTSAIDADIVVTIEAPVPP